MPPASESLAPHFVVASAYLIVFSYLSFRLWRKAHRLLLTQVIAFSPVFFSLVSLLALAYPPPEIYFQPRDPTRIVNMFLVAGGLGLGALALVERVVHRPLPQPPQSGVLALRLATAAAAAVALAAIAAMGVNTSFLTGAGRAAIRDGSPILVALLGYFFPMAALAFARREGTVANRWTGGCLAMSTGSVLIGFRGLLLTAIAAALIGALHLADPLSRRWAKALAAASGLGLVALTLARPGADGSLHQALANRVVYTTVYQIEKAMALHETAAPGAWIWADFQARLGADVVTLQQAVWRVDFPQSQFVGGSYPAVGDLAGNFGWFWWFAFFLLLLPAVWWDGMGASMAPKRGVLVNDLLVLIAVRVAFFGLSAAYTPLVLVCVIWMAVAVGGRWQSTWVSPGEGQRRLDDAFGDSRFVRGH